MSDAPATIPAALREAAATFGDRPAYVFEGNTLTYAELLDRVRSVASGFVTMGLQPADRVVIWGPNSLDWAVAALAASYAGATVVPANSRYVAPEVADLVERTHARLVLVADGFLGKTQIADLQATGKATNTAIINLSDGLDPIADQADPGIDIDAIAAAVSPDDIADILFTSGTTGRSKGVMSAHRQSVGVARVWGELGGVNEADKYLVINPFFHSFGYKIGIIVGLLFGPTLYPVATFDLDETMRVIQDEKITLLPGAPTIFQSILTAPNRSDYDLTSLRLAVTGAAVVPVVLIEQMRDVLQIDKVVTAFGMTEAVVVTMCREGDSAETIANTCGRVVPNMQMRIGDEGELLLKGDYVMLGYLDDPKATAEAIKDGWLHTGDVGVIDEVGNLMITDRLKDMYISGGFNVYPAEVEQTLIRLDGVNDVAVVGIPDERMGEVGRAFVVRRDDSLQEADVLAHAKATLANYKVPRQVAFVDVLPRNLGGKVLKNELRDQVKQGDTE
ncbi:MAG: AMP-binding protein [Nocardioidaceae bacterium]